MAALNVEQYRNQVKKAIDRWTTRLADGTKQLARINEGIAELEKRLECATPEGEKKFKADAYKFLGWDEKGIPTEATLKAYNLDFLIDDLNAARKKYNL